MKPRLICFLSLCALLSSTLLGCSGGGQNVTTTVYTQPPAPKPAAFSVGTVSIKPSIVVVNQQTVITADVKNTGEVSGSYSAELKVNGATSQTTSTTVNGGATQTVTFNYKADKAGTFEVGIGDSKATVTVLDVGVYSSPTHSYSFAYPTQWVADPSLMPGLSYDLTDKASVGVIVLPIFSPSADAQTNLDNSAMPFWADLSSLFIPQFKETAKTKTTFNSLPAYRIDFTALFDETKPLSTAKGSAFVTVHGGLTFIVLGVVIDAEYANYWPVVENCMSSFQPPKTPLAWFVDERGYSLVYPLTWTGGQEADGTLVVWAPGNTANLFAGIDSLNRVYALDEYNTAVMKSFTASSTPYTVVKSTKITLSNGEAAYVNELSTTTTSGSKLFVKVLTVVQGLQGFTIGCQTLDSNRALFEPTMDGIFNSFAFETQ